MTGDFALQAIGRRISRWFDNADQIFADVNHFSLVFNFLVVINK